MVLRQEQRGQGHVDVGGQILFPVRDDQSDHRSSSARCSGIFWRDPARGLIGLYGSYSAWDKYGGVHATHLAAEGEAYWGRWTLQGIAGVENNGSANIVTTTISPAINPTTITTLTQTVSGGTRFFDQVNLAYYINDNLKAYIGIAMSGNEHALGRTKRSQYR